MIADRRISGKLDLALAFFDVEIAFRLVSAKIDPNVGTNPALLEIDVISFSISDALYQLSTLKSNYVY